MLYVVVVAQPDTTQERNLSRYWSECLAQSGVDELPVVLKYMHNAFNHETDELLSLIRKDATGLLLVVAEEDLWKHPVGNFVNRLNQDHPAINFSRVSVGILLDSKSEPYTGTLVDKLVGKLTKLKATVLPPAFNHADGAELTKWFAQLRSKAA